MSDRGEQKKKGGGGQKGPRAPSIYASASRFRNRRTTRQDGESALHATAVAAPARHGARGRSGAFAHDEARQPPETVHGRPPLKLARNVDSASDDALASCRALTENRTAPLVSAMDCAPSEKLPASSRRARAPSIPKPTEAPRRATPSFGRRRGEGPRPRMSGIDGPAPPFDSRILSDGGFLHPSVEHRPPWTTKASQPFLRETMRARDLEDRARQANAFRGGAAPSPETQSTQAAPPPHGRDGGAPPQPPRRPTWPARPAWRGRAASAGRQASAACVSQPATPRSTRPDR